MNLLATLLARGLAKNETEARGLILAGKVLVEDTPATKPGVQVHDSAEIRIRGVTPYVSRGGYKLAGALETFSIPVTGRSFLDIGASTGGFTDVLLQRGAAFVAALDVGRGLLHQKLRTDERVQVLEDCDFKKFDAQQLLKPVEAFVADVSFTSLMSLVVKAFSLLTPVSRPREGIVLFKPQFELPRAERDKLEKGILTDAARASALMDEFASAMESHRIRVAGRETAVIRGTKGNQEYTLHLVQDS